MADLSTISTASPADADSVSAGAGKIRETRDAVVTSFSGTDAGTGSTLSEHYQKGGHKFPNGNGTATAFSGAPTAGNANRIFIDTTNHRILRDTGTVWELLRTAGAQISTTSTTGIGTTGSYVDLDSVTVNVVTSAMIKIEAIVSVAGFFAGSVAMRGWIDGATLATGGIRTYSFVPSVVNQFSFLAVHAGLTPGNHTVAVQIKGDAPANAIYSQSLLIITQI